MVPGPQVLWLFCPPELFAAVIGANTLDSADTHIKAEFQYWKCGCSTFTFFCQWPLCCLNILTTRQMRRFPRGIGSIRAGWKVWTKAPPTPPESSETRVSYLCTFSIRNLFSQRDGWVCSWSCFPRTRQTRYSFCCSPACGWWSNDQTLDRCGGTGRRDGGGFLCHWHSPCKRQSWLLLAPLRLWERNQLYGEHYALTADGLNVC